MLPPNSLQKSINDLRKEVLDLRRVLQSFMVKSSLPEHDLMGDLSSTQTTSDNAVTYIEEHDERDYEINGGSR